MIVTFSKTFSLAAILASILLANSASGAEPTDAVDVQNGLAFYGETCIACHGKAGKGAFPGIPDLSKPDGPLAKSDEILMENIHNGIDRPDADFSMPPLGAISDMSMEDLRDVLAYMRQSFDVEEPKKEE